MHIPHRVLQEFKERLDRYAEAYQLEVELFLGAPLEKQHDRSNVIAPGAELPKPRFSKPSEREADLPESWFPHEEALPVIEGRGKAGTARVQKADSLLRDALIVERIREVAVLASAADAKKLFTKALKLAAYIKSEIALQEARAYIKMLGHKARATDEKIEKARVYLKPGEEPPEGIDVKDGPRGGRYYLTEDLDRVWRERGEEHRRAEERGDLVHVENLSEKAAEAVKSCLRTAKAIGWSCNVHSVEGYDEGRWAAMWGVEGTKVGGKLITTALPYAAYDSGKLILGPSAVRHLEAVLGGATDWSATFVVPAIAHETCHSVNPIGRAGYGGTNALIEEALTEWLQPDLAERLFTDVFGWSALDAKARAVVGTYFDEVENIEWAALTVVGGMHTRDTLHAKIKEWKETLNPDQRDGAIRVEVIAAYLRQAFPDIPDDLIEEVAHTNQAFINWSDMWQASSTTEKHKARHNLLADALTMAQRQLQHKGLLDVDKTEPTPKGPEARKQAARDRVKRWRERLKEEGREEVHVAKRPEGWAWAIRNKKGLGMSDWSPEDMAQLRRILPHVQEVVTINGTAYPLLARKTARGLSWFISDHKGRRISETVYGGDGAAAFLEILRREVQHAEGLRKDFAGPPADAMTGADVGPIAPGCARCRRKVEKHDTEENPEHSHDPTQEGGGKPAYLNVWTRKSEIENLLRSAKVGGRLVAHAQGFELETGRADKVKATLEPAGFKVEKFARTRPGSTAPAHMRAYGHVVKVIGVLITDPSDKIEKHEQRWHGEAFQKGFEAARYITRAESPHSGDKLHTDYTAKQGDTHSASAQDTSIVAPETGEGTEYQEYNAACKGGTCSLQAALSPDGEPYTPEVLTKAVPQGTRMAYGAVHTLYKAEDDEEKEYVVGGYASPQVIDKEHHLITKEAMREDLVRFLAEPKYRNAMLLHSNVQVGEVLPQWTHPKTGQVFKTTVDDIGLFCVIKIRTDPNRPPIVDQVIKDIEDGKLASFSISGDAPLESRHYTCQDGKCFWLISRIVFYEITICELGVNQDAKLVVLSKSADARRTSCLTCGGKVDKAETTLIDIAESKIHQSYTDAMDRLRALGHLTRKERIDLSDAITDALDAFRKKVESLGLATRKVPADDAALLAKGEVPERVKLVARIMEGLGELGDADLRLLADDRWPTLPDGDTDSAEELKEKVEAVAEAIGEEQAIQMLEDVQQADSLQVKAGGIGDSTPTSGAVTQDVGRTVSKATDETAPWESDEVQQQVAIYERYVKRGAQPNEAYDKMLEDAPSWFGTSAKEFGLFLVALHQSGLPIPQVRLRIAGEEQGERVPDPHWTAESLLDAWLEALSDYKSRLEEAPRGEVRLLAKHDTEENPAHSHDPTRGGGDVPAHDRFTVDRNPDMPAVWRDYSAADSPGKVGAVTRKWQKLDDAGQARISAGALFFLKDQRLEQLPRSTATRSTAAARADRIFTIRDSTGRGRARKRN